jgi:hypothetical protein
MRRRTRRPRSEWTSSATTSARSYGPRALVHVDELVEGEREQLRALAPTEWLGFVRAPAARALAGSDAEAVAGLLAYAARALAVAIELRCRVQAETVEVAREWALENALELLAPADIATLGDESARAWADDLAGAAEAYERAGAPLEAAEAAVEVVLHLLVPALWALAAVAATGLAAVRRRPDATPSGLPLAAPRLVDGRQAGPLAAWVETDALDWVAAERAARAAGSELSADLTTLREAMAAEYHRLVGCEEVGEARVWVTAGEWRDGWTLEPAIDRLRAHGILAAAGFYEADA